MGATVGLQDLASRARARVEQGTVTLGTLCDTQASPTLSSEARPALELLDQAAEMLAELVSALANPMQIIGALATIAAEKTGQESPQPVMAWNPDGGLVVTFPPTRP